MKNAIRTTVLFLIVFLGPITLPAEEIWTIGKNDNTNLDLLDLRTFTYHLNVREPFVFRVGTDLPEKKWPSIQPGPDVKWGGEHRVFTLLFDAPAINRDAEYIFILDGSAYADTPPVFSIELNGVSREIRTEPDCHIDFAASIGQQGDSRSYEAVFPGTCLREKENRLVITPLSGSWFAYDRVALYSRTGTIEDISVEPMPGLLRPESGKGPHPLKLVRLHYQGEKLKKTATLRIEIPDLNWNMALTPAEHAEGVDIPVPIIDTQQSVDVSFILDLDGRRITRRLTVPPERSWEIHLIHQTHLDIGYTHVQEEVLARQVQAIRDALQYIKETADYPPEARFKWHPEGMWAVEEFLRVATPEEKDAFLRAARSRDMHLDVLYAQAMTGMYNEEELFELTAKAVRFGKEHDIVIDSAMQTDVPGHTWGLVSALAQNGVRYMSVAPNYSHRVGRVFHWGDKPFWWESPSGKERILFWMLGTSYVYFFAKPADHELREYEIHSLVKLYEKLGADYPYDLLPVRYQLVQDNGPPNRSISDAVAKWNEKYHSPRLILSRNSDVLAAMEERYGDSLPVLRGDYTPYWEDGAASTSDETAINRDAHERILQAQTLWTLLSPGDFPFKRFDAAWTDIIMFDEHTWGAHSSHKDPDGDFTKQQERYKRAYAVRGRDEAIRLQGDLLAKRRDESSSRIEVFNTSSWMREDWVWIDRIDVGGVKDPEGTFVPTRRSPDQSAFGFLARVPSFGSRVYTLTNEPADAVPARVKIEGNKILFDGGVLEVDPVDGTVVRFVKDGRDIVKPGDDGNRGLNDFLRILGRNPEVGRHRIRKSGEWRSFSEGSCCASFVFRAEIDGCNEIERKITYDALLGRIEIRDVVDKKMERRLEGLFFGFPFHLEKGRWHIDIPWVAMRVEEDQLPGANRNFYPIQRFCNYSNDEYNIDWISMDAPMVQFAPIRYTSVRNMDTEWRDRIEPGGTVYSWICNNHWTTNYKAGQEGRLVFRYVIRPNPGTFDPAGSQKFARDIYQPLIAIPVKDGIVPLDGVSFPALEKSPVVVTSIKPSREDVGVFVVRLYNTSDRPASFGIVRELEKIGMKPSLSNPLGQKRDPIEAPLEFAPFEIKTLRLEPI